MQHIPQRGRSSSKRGFLSPSSPSRKQNHFRSTKRVSISLLMNFVTQVVILVPITPPIPSGHNAFNFNRGLYCEWIKYLFSIKKIIDGTKMFKFSGIGITTNAVSASVHHNKPEWDEDVSLHQSIMALNLMTYCKQDEDDDTVEDESYNPFTKGNAIHFLLFWYLLCV